MKYNKVTLRLIKEYEYSIDFFHPIKSKGRIRRKIKTDALTAQKIQNGIEFLICNEVFYSYDNIDFARKALLNDPIFSSSSLDVVNLILDIFHGNTTNDNIEFKSYIDTKIPYPSDVPKVLIVGNYGDGKSFMIKHLTNFADNINFPFKDTSKTISYKTEYIFKHPDQNNFKFAVSLLPFNSLKQQIKYCIDRAIEAKIDCLFDVENDESDTEEDVVISAFISDPTNVFDLRFIMGNYYRVTSKQRQSDSKIDQVTFWSKVYDYITLIFNDIKNNHLNFILNSIVLSELSNKEFLKFKYYEYLCELLVLDDSNYNKLLNYVISEIVSIMHSIKSTIQSMSLLENIEFYRLDENDWYTGFYCEIKTYDSSDFENFIRIFTSREVKDFRKILTTLIDDMRIELPFGKNILSEYKNQSIVLIDTVGISHTNEHNSSIQNSTNFKLNNVDIIILVDDSRLSMALDTQNTLVHLFNRVVHKKIFIAYTFFDEFSESEFIEDEEENEISINEKKCNYLYQIQNNKISNILKDTKNCKNYFIKDLMHNTFFISDLKYSSNESYSEINRLLGEINNYYKNGDNYLLISKCSKDYNIIEYDFKKLPIIFFKEIRKKYIEKQNYIYITNPPNSRITESLTYKLSQGETYYCGSVTLKPVDDLYSIMIDSLSSFILNPQNTNFYKDDESNLTDNYKFQILEKLNELVAEKLSVLTTYEFTNTYIIDKWDKLYLESNIGSDSRRRTGIIRIINELLPPVDIYMSLNSRDNWIDKIENIIKESLVDLETLIKNEKLKYMIKLEPHQRTTGSV